MGDTDVFSIEASSINVLFFAVEEFEFDFGEIEILNVREHYELPKGKMNESRRNGK